jgi:1-acyl-sn-glycerol-3-phosphate acyltransferase
MKILAKIILFLFGWKKTSSYPKIPKSVCLMAPHTSMWDFIWGKLYFMSEGLSPKIMIKKEMFSWYLSPILKSLGGIPVDRKNPVGIVEQILKHINQAEQFILIITPEGTRKNVKIWKTGGIRIAKNANIPLVLGEMDYKKKTMGLIKSYLEIPDDPKFINQIKQDYKHVKGKHPERFNADYEQ